MRSPKASRWKGIVGAAALSVAFSAGAVIAAEPVTPAPGEGELAVLVARLGDPDYRAREEATQRLRKIGKPALPALREAVKNAVNPEVQGRAASLVRRIEFGDLPGGPIDEANANRVVARGLSISMNDGVRTIKVNDGIRDITIREGNAGIELVVSANQDGQPATATYKAASRAELRAEEPQAFRLYDLWAGRFPGFTIRGAEAVQIHGDAVIAPGVRGDDVELRELGDRVEREMAEAGLDVQVRKDVFARIDQLRELRAGDPMASDEQKVARMKMLFARSDELRKRIEELKLKDPGELLPPPARSRLGIQFAPLPAPAGQGMRVVVDQVLADGRGAELGIKSGDVLQKINETVITDTKQVRPALMQAKEPLTIEVERDGQTLKLTGKGA